MVVRINHTLKMAARQRHRRVVVCTNCHQRKRKCNRSDPCSSCIRGGLEKSCRYQSSPSELTHPSRLKDASLETLETTTQTIRHTHDSSPLTCDDLLLPLFNMSKALNRNKLGQHSVFHFRGILSHLMMVNGDPSSVIVWDYIFSLKDDQMSLKTVYAENKVVAREHVEALDRQSMNYFGPKYIKRLTTSPNEDEVVSVRQAISRYGSAVGIVFRPELEWRQSSMIHQIDILFPSRDAIEMLVDIYFSRCLPGSCCISKQRFQKSYRALLISDTGYKQPEELKILNVSTKKDIATLATLIIVLRFAFLSLTNPFGGESVRTDMNKAEIDDLSQNPICLDLINCADRILRELDISVDICDETMQAMFLFFLYRLTSPESDIHSSDRDIRTCFRLVVQMAQSLNYNEDPRNIREWMGVREQDETLEHYRRTFWYYLVTLDAYLAILFGDSPAIQSNAFNTALPILGAEIPQELVSILKAIHDTWPVMCLLKTLCNMATIGSETPLHKVEQKIEELENVSMRLLGNAEDYLTLVTGQVDTDKLFKFICFVHVRCLLLSYYYSLYVYFESAGNCDKSVRYILKLFKTTLNDLAIFQAGLLQMSDKFFGSGSWMSLLLPSIACNKLRIIAIQFRLRMGCTIEQLTKDNQLQNLRKIKVLLGTIEDIDIVEDKIMHFVDILSKVLQCSWFDCKAFKFGRRLSRNKEVWERIPQLFNEAFLRCSSDTIESLEWTVKEAKSTFCLYEQLYLRLHCGEAEALLLESPTVKLMDYVQLDKMWELLRILEKYFAEKDLKWKLSQTSLVDSGSDDLWEADLEALWNFEGPLLLENMDK